MGSALPQVPWQIKYTRRRGTIGLRIDRDQLWILAPKGTGIRAIEQLLRERKTWIEQGYADQQARPSSQKTYQSGERWLIQGQAFPLLIQVDESAPAQACLEQEQLRLTLPDQDYPIHQRAELVQRWFVDQAQQQWPSRLEQWSQTTGLAPSGLKIRHYKSRWGSCNSRGLITLNSLLLMAPEQVLDYVIVHELCHLHHPNHSSAFWQLVEQHYPGWQQQRLWLRQHQASIRF